jgi:hypothetical protein
MRCTRTCFNRGRGKLEYKIVKHKFDAIKKRHPSGPFLKFDSSKLVGQRSGDLPPDFPLRETVNVDYAHGGSQIVPPLGIPLVPPTSGDTILYAECQADMIKVWKAIRTSAGAGRPY